MDTTERIMAWSELQKKKGIKLTLTWWRDRWKKYFDHKTHYFHFPNSADGYEKALLALAKLRGQTSSARQAATLRQMIAVADPNQLVDAKETLEKLDAGKDLPIIERPMRRLEPAARMVWRDRMERAENPPAGVQTVAAEIQKFLNHKFKQVDGDQRDSTTWRDLEGALRVFEEWIGSTFPIKKITTATVKGYYDHLLSKKGQNRTTKEFDVLLSATRKNNLFRLWRQWMYWIWEQDDCQLVALPKNIKSKDFIFTGTTLRPHASSIWTHHDLRHAFKSLSPVLRAMTLLCLNCAFTQNDLNVLKKSQISGNRLIHRRQKTRKLANPPLLNYKLWQVTVDALAELKDNGSENVFLLRNGSHLICKKIVEVNGIKKHRKHDAVSRQWNRLKHAGKVTKPFKYLRKTGATILKRNTELAWLRQVFIGETDTNTTDKHYALMEGGIFPPLDQAIDYIGNELQIDELQHQKKQTATKTSKKKASV